MGGGQIETTFALQSCQTLDNHYASTASRVQKLERSRGQINKDIQDMLKEVQEWRRAAEAKQLESDSPGSNGSPEAEKADASRASPSHRGMTAPSSSGAPSTPPSAAQSSVTPPPGLGTVGGGAA